jgi:hypothetical protein
MQALTNSKHTGGNHWDGIHKKVTGNRAKANKRYDTDKVFDLCLLLITVIAGAELGYSATANELVVTEQIFRWTTLPLLLLIPLWILLMLLPPTTIKFKGLENHFSRRFLKEFCWAFFGNIFALELSTFFALQTNSPLTANVPTALFLSGLFLFVLTFYAVLQYQREDHKNSSLIDVEKTIYRLTFFLLFVIELVLISFLLWLKLMDLTFYAVFIVLIIITIDCWLLSFNDRKRRKIEQKRLSGKRLFLDRAIKLWVFPLTEYLMIYFISYVITTMIILESLS